MANQPDPEEAAAKHAAQARQAIAKKIASLAPKAEDDADAQLILHLAQAYSELAAEPPRARGG